MRDFEPPREEAQFCDLTCRLKIADRYLNALFAMVRELNNHDVEREQIDTLFMLLSEARSNILDAQQIKDELMGLHAPDQIIPRPDPSERLMTLAQWQRHMRREGVAS